MVKNLTSASDEVSLGLNGISSDEPMFPISTVAGILEVHERTLRIYDAENILVPERSKKGRRLYSVNDIKKGELITYLSRNLGINIIGIKFIFEFLVLQKIQQNQYKSFIEDLGKKINISPEMQQENKEKFSKRGRKPKQEK